MLVSVIVITYNSSKYVIDTLESVKNQTYKKIELIISDDCSKDNTYEICKEWINANSKRFISTKLVKTNKNGGICHNYNNGLKYAKGEWIKYIAGDDKLFDICIEKLVERTYKNDDKFLISKQKHFSKQNTNIGITPLDLSTYQYKFSNINKRIKFQEKYLLQIGPKIPGPTIFLHRDTLIKLGGFEEKYPFIEDFPLAMKYLKNGYPIGCVNMPLIEYRVYPESVSRSDSRFANSIFNAIDDYCIPAAKRNKLWCLYYHYWLNKKIRNNDLRFPTSYVLKCLDILSLKKYFQKFLKANHSERN